MSSTRVGESLDGETTASIVLRVGQVVPCSECGTQDLSLYLVVRVSAACVCVFARVGLVCHRCVSSFGLCRLSIVCARRWRNNAEYGRLGQQLRHLARNRRRDAHRGPTGGGRHRTDRHPRPGAVLLFALSRLYCISKALSKGDSILRSSAAFFFISLDRIAHKQLQKSSFRRDADEKEKKRKEMLRGVSFIFVALPSC